jgi:ribose 5-phosphate isomerase B
MGRPLITERDVLEAARNGLKLIKIEPNSIITAAASDSAQKHHINFSIQALNEKSVNPSIEKTTRKVEMHETKTASISIAIGSDHGGFQMKEVLKTFLVEQGHNIIDVGTDSEKACDYPDFAYAVASLVSSGKVERGIMIDSVGIASAIVANKVPRVRAAPCYNEFIARSSREHNDANLLTLGSKILGIDLTKTIVKVWLEAQFSGGRHQPRVNKIADVEKRFSKMI